MSNSHFSFICVLLLSNPNKNGQESYIKLLLTLNIKVRDGFSRCKQGVKVDKQINKE